MGKYRVNEVCQATGLSRKTIYRKMASGLLVYSVEDGKRYVNKEDLEKLAQANKRKTATSSNMCQKCVGLRDEIINLRQEIERLAAAIETATQHSDTQKRDIKPSRSSTPKTLGGDNAKRSKEAKERLFNALDGMKEIPMYRGNPSITGIHKATGIDRGTISKYISEYTKRSKNRC